MDLREIRLQDKTHIEELNIKNNSKNYLTALSFQSLYTWQDPLGLKIFLKDRLCIIYSLYHKSYFCPLGDTEDIMKFVDELIENGESFKIMYLSENQAEELKKSRGADIKINRDLSEYIYDSQSLALNENTSHNFRRKVKNFIKNNNYKANYICKEDLLQIKDIIDVSGDDGLVLNRMIESYKELDLKGVILKDDNANTAFLIGYENSADIFTMSIVKSTPEWKKESVSACIFEMAKLICNKYKYINMEEDLGILGLRKMKTLYQPIKMIDAWEAEFNFEDNP